MNEQFKKDVEAGLSKENRTLPSKYFYDAIGDELFVKIMHSDEYYLTRAELEIFQSYTSELVEAFGFRKDQYFELIELGAGDGLKTLELLTYLDREGYKFAYFPIDISENALNTITRKIHSKLPDLKVEPNQGDYFQVLESFRDRKVPKVILFLGSNIGNMQDDIASQFIYNLSINLNKNDKLLLGVDLIKSADIVLPAYNDSQGYTKAFNLNLLRRINEELDADFQLENWSHSPEYNEDEGIARSYLVSETEQVVNIGALEKSYLFQKGERIHTEISRKYNDAILNKILEGTDFIIETKIKDSKSYFADYILKRV